MRTSAAAALVVLVGLMLPFFMSPGHAYAACIWAYKGWTVVSLALWFVLLKYAGRRWMELAMRRPGGRLKAGEHE
jgi:hypothetical protein